MGDATIHVVIPGANPTLRGMCNEVITNTVGWVKLRFYLGVESFRARE